MANMGTVLDVELFMGGVNHIWRGNGGNLNGEDGNSVGSGNKGYISFSSVSPLHFFYCSQSL